MTDELSPIIVSLRAARLANEASINALLAVEQMLGYGDTTSPSENPDDGEQQLELALEACTHKKGVVVSTMSGSYRLCDCGEQISI
jgi:hypothetical protein